MADRRLDEDEAQSDANAGLRQHFPGYFMPNDEELRQLIVDGFASFDTNALFDIYRFNPQARTEYISALKLLGNRLWISNRVGREILDRRLDVIRECAEANTVFAGELRKTFDLISEQVRTFGNRRGLSRLQISTLEEIGNRACASVTKRASEYFEFELDFDGSVRSEAILSELESILEGKVGPAFRDLEAEEIEGQRRISEQIPPGYADSKKDPDRAIGDYFVWRQLLTEAAARSKPVLLVSNEKKPDWIRSSSGRRIGPRPELVLEMRNFAGVGFHLVNVKSFLLLAQKHLGAKVSESTVNQAQQLGNQPLAGDMRGGIFLQQVKLALTREGLRFYEQNLDYSYDLVVETDDGLAYLVLKSYTSPLPSSVVRNLIGDAERLRHGRLILISASRLTQGAAQVLATSDNAILVIQWNESDGSTTLYRSLIDAIDGYRFGPTSATASNDRLIGYTDS